MKGLDLYLKVRHAVRIEGLSERAAARRFGIDPRREPVGAREYPMGKKESTAARRSYRGNWNKVGGSAG